MKARDRAMVDSLYIVQKVVKKVAITRYPLH